MYFSFRQFKDLNYILVVAQDEAEFYPKDINPATSPSDTSSGVKDAFTSILTVAETALAFSGHPIAVGVGVVLFTVQTIITLDSALSEEGDTAIKALDERMNDLETNIKGYIDETVIKSVKAATASFLSWHGEKSYLLQQQDPADEALLTVNAVFSYSSSKPSQHLP